MEGTTTDGDRAGDPAALAATVLDEEARREAAQTAAREETVLPDDLLPGVGDVELSLREGLRQGGVALIAVLAPDPPPVGLLQNWARHGVARGRFDTSARWLGTNRNRCS